MMHGEHVSHSPAGLICMDINIMNRAHQHALSSDGTFETKGPRMSVRHECLGSHEQNQVSHSISGV